MFGTPPTSPCASLLGAAKAGRKNATSTHAHYSPSRPHCARARDANAARHMCEPRANARPPAACRRRTLGAVRHVWQVRSKSEGERGSSELGHRCHRRHLMRQSRTTRSGGNPARPTPDLVCRLRHIIGHLAKFATSNLEDA